MPTPVRLAAPAAAVAVLVAVASPAPATAAGDTQPPTSEGRPAALLWGGQFFLKQDEFEEWLRLRKQDYETWANLHPVAQEILEGAVASPPQLEGAGSSGGRGADAGSSTGWLLLGLGVAGACALALSTLPIRRLVPNPAVAEFFEEKRIAASALGIGVLVGVAVAKLLA